LIYPPHLWANDVLYLSLEEAEGVGLTNSVILVSLKERREVFKMIAAEKWRNYLPRVGITYFGLKNANVNQPDSHYNDVRLQLNQLLYDGGENSLEIESAKLQELLNGEDWKIARERLLLDIRKAYIRFLSAEVKTLSAESAYLKSKKQWLDAKAERREGFFTELQELESSNKLHELELNLIKNQSLFNQSEIELKKVLNLPLGVNIRLKETMVWDYVLYAPNFFGEEEEVALDLKPEIKKSKIAIENLKTRNQITENYWKPKLFVGGYYGENINGSLPVKNDVYGFSFSLQTQLGSSTSQTTSNYGIQTDGTGIQRIPGFGPQFVGRGENAFNSSTLNLLDDLSYSRKIYEGKIALSDALRSKQLLEISVQAEVFKSKEKFKESWMALALTNSKFLASLQTWKSIEAKYKSGFVKDLDVLSAEQELMKSVEELISAMCTYLESGMEYSFALAIPPADLKFFDIQKDHGNSILLQLWKDKKQFSTIPAKDLKPKKKSSYEYYLEE